ncbi:uncharacterized protein TM35_000016430 [Trypanosoma theileri]|uniref:Uncharacterized protein n=1 Tax=Trypanosoma theileri TaxID=67003 RepID=A0A1X0PA20_9TRYP|nr:uncharacterized protein TM35_000016430 [Trypanosoma theileri]ORC93766.1 hypothetical protein TM35_000016430 [Trypanosoma theileri]
MRCPVFRGTLAYLFLFWCLSLALLVTTGTTADAKERIKVSEDTGEISKASGTLSQENDIVDGYQDDEIRRLEEELARLRKLDEKQKSLEEETDRHKLYEQQSKVLQTETKEDESQRSEAEEAAQRQAEAEEAKRRRAEAEEAERRRAEAEEAERRQAEAEEAARRRAEAEEAERRRAEAEEAERRRAEAEEAERRRAEAEEAARRQAEAEEAARRRAEAEEAAQRQAEAEEAERRRAEAEEAKRRRAEAEEAAQRRAEAEEAERRRAEAEEAAQRQAEAEEAERRRAETEEAERRQAEAEEAKRRQAEAEEAAQRQAEAEEETLVSLLNRLSMQVSMLEESLTAAKDQVPSACFTMGEGTDVCQDPLRAFRAAAAGLTVAIDHLSDLSKSKERKYGVHTEGRIKDSTDVHEIPLGETPRRGKKAFQSHSVSSNDNVAAELENAARGAGYDLERFNEKKVPVNLRDVWTWVGTVVVFLVVGAAKRFWPFSEEVEGREEKTKNHVNGHEENQHVKENKDAANVYGETYPPNEAPDREQGIQKDVNPDIKGTVRRLPASNVANTVRPNASQTTPFTGIKPQGVGASITPPQGVGAPPQQAPPFSVGDARHGPPTSGVPKQGVGASITPPQGVGAPPQQPPPFSVGDARHGPPTSGVPKQVVGASNTLQGSSINSVPSFEQDAETKSFGESLNELRNPFLQRWS